jgi:hypothetical protein
MSTRYCPDCNREEENAETTHCGGCGFAYLMTPPERVRWLPPSEEGLKLGVVKGSPLERELFPPH